MATLNQIADSIAGALDRAGDVMLTERIKFHVKELRATYIRRDTERNEISSRFLQRFKVDLILVDNGDWACVPLGANG